MKTINLYSTLPIVGGNSTQTLELAKFFIDQGHSVNVLARNQQAHGLNEAVIKEIIKKGATVTVLPDSNFKLIGNLIKYLLSVWKNSDETVFISIGMGNLAPFIALLGNYNLKLFYFITHDLELKPLKKLGFTINIFHKIIVISPASLLPFKNLISNTIPCVWLPQFSELKTKLVFNNCTSKLVPTFGFIGSLKESKGVLELLKWWDVRKDEALLFILGGGELEKEVKDAASRDSRIFYKGSFSATERENILPFFFKSIDYLVVPSIGHHEGLPTVILEALSFGVPVVSTPGGGTIAFSQDILSHDFNGIVELVREEEMAAFLEKLKPVDNATRENIVEIYRKWFSNEVLSKAWRKILE